MNLSLKSFKDPILQEKLQDFDFSKPDIDPELLEKTLVSLMLQYRGVGLAANQIGYNRRVFAMGTKESADALFNPIIIEESEEKVIESEGCLSFPGIYIEIERPKGLIVECYNSKGDPQNFELVGFDARIFYHELRHLNGDVFLQDVSRLKLERAIKKAKTYNFDYKISDFSKFL